MDDHDIYTKFKTLPKEFLNDALRFIGHVYGIKLMNVDDLIVAEKPEKEPKFISAEGIPVYEGETFYEVWHNDLKQLTIDKQVAGGEEITYATDWSFRRFKDLKTAEGYVQENGHCYLLMEIESAVQKLGLTRFQYNDLITNLLKQRSHD